MVALNTKIYAAVIAALLLTVCIFVVAAQVLVQPPSHPGEGHVDPASGIHIAPSGDITGAPLNFTSILREGDVYRLTSNITNMVTIDRSNVVFEGDGFSFLGSHGLRLTSVSNVTVKNLNVDTHYFQTVLQNVKNSVIQNVSSVFRVLNSNYNLISNCSTRIELENSNYNTIQNCGTSLVSLLKSNNNKILYSTFWSQGPSIGFYSSSNNLVFGNTFEKFWWWLNMGSGSTNNKIVANNVWAGQFYLEDELVGTNYLYHNNFYNFKWNQSATTNSANVWSSDGRGNYWANFHTGDTNNDGIVDTPYTIDKTNKDEYPLTAPVDIGAESLPQ